MMSVWKDIDFILAERPINLNFNFFFKLKKKAFKPKLF